MHFSIIIIIVYSSSIHLYFQCEIYPEGPQSRWAKFRDKYLHTDNEGKQSLRYFCLLGTGHYLRWAVLDNLTLLKLPLLIHGASKHS